MSLRAINGGRPRRETAEYAFTQGMREARRVMAVEALITAGIAHELAKLCVHQLESGAHNAFARAYTYVDTLVEPQTFKIWLLTHGYREVLGETPAQPTRADLCAGCSAPLSPKSPMGVYRAKAGTVLLRCAECASKHTTLGDVVAEYETDLSEMEM